MNELRRQFTLLDAERPSLSAKLATAKDAQEDFARQASQFREGRMPKLEARIAEIESSIEAAIAQREETTAAFERATSLAKTGTVSTVELARRTRDRSIAQQTETGARRRRGTVRIHRYRTRHVSRRSLQPPTKLNSARRRDATARSRPHSRSLTPTRKLIGLTDRSHLSNCTTLVGSRLILRHPFPGAYGR